MQLAERRSRSYDVVVVGGGPAGMFAAGAAAREGASVLLLEKNSRCGAKLLITGKGRCNVTNNESDPRRFVTHFGQNGKAFLTALYAFGVSDTINFFEQYGLPLTVERGGRVFPSRGNALDVLRVLEQSVADAGVTLATTTEVAELRITSKRVETVVTTRGDVAVGNLIVATGGLSYRETGCTGDGYRWARAAGHAVVKPEPALVAVKLAEEWTADVCEFNLRNVRLCVVQNGKVVDERFGEAFFTRSGIGGPIVLDLSKTIRKALAQGDVVLSLDLKPAVSSDTFDRRLQREFEKQGKRDFRNVLGALLPRDMIPLFVHLSGIPPEKKCHAVTRDERQRLLALFKELPLTVTACGDFRRAIVTAGGITLREIDMRSMRSKRIDNLFFAGEVVDLDGPTGGFNLQVCWSTGYLAGISAARDA